MLSLSVTLGEIFILTQQWWMQKASTCLFMLFGVQQSITSCSKRHLKATQQTQQQSYLDLYLEPNWFSCLGIRGRTLLVYIWALRSQIVSEESRGCNSRLFMAFGTILHKSWPSWSRGVATRRDGKMHFLWGDRGESEEFKFYNVYIIYKIKKQIY